MKVFVAGATGRVGRALVDDLVAAGHEVMAAGRHPGVFEGREGVRPVELDLDGDVDAIAQRLDGADAVYFTAGSRGERLLRVDLFGAVKLMQAAQRRGVERFVMLSSMFADEPERWNIPSLRDITDYNIAKFFADQWLMHDTDLNYTIVQPGVLVEADEADGLVRLEPEHPTSNTIPNVALVLTAVLGNPHAYRRVIRMCDGDVPVERALDELGEAR